MAAFAMPAIDQNICANWPEQDQDFYSKLPYYLEAAKATSRDTWETWEPLLTDTRPWKPNMGDTMKLVMTEDSPILRQTARPNALRVEAKGDYFGVRERTATASLVWQKFFSLKFRFLASFQDFMKGQLIPTRKTIEKQIRHFKEVFYRTHLWDAAPYVWVAGHGLVNAPVGHNADGTPKKDAAWIQSMLQLIPAEGGNLSYSEFSNMMSVAVEEVGMTPYGGSSTPGDGHSSLNEEWCWVTSQEQYLQLLNDPWVKAYRPQEQDLANKRFKPTPFGSLKARMERFPLRWTTDENLLPTENAPETIITDVNSSEYGRTLPNPLYAKKSNAPFVVDWFVGDNAGTSRLDVGAPPEMFAGGTSDPAKIAGMEWNGRVYATKNIPIKCTDADGNEQLDLNSFGEYLRWQAALTLGAVSPNPHEAMPIISKRRTGITLP